jgi:hypothetical protein
MNHQNPAGWELLPYEVRVAGKEAAERNATILRTHRPAGITVTVNEAVEHIFRESFLIGWVEAYLFLHAKEVKP